jgi:hypothetical protein
VWKQPIRSVRRSTRDIEPHTDRDAGGRDADSNAGGGDADADADCNAGGGDADTDRNAGGGDRNSGAHRDAEPYRNADPDCDTDSDADSHAGSNRSGTDVTRIYWIRRAQRAERFGDRVGLQRTVLRGGLVRGHRDGRERVAEVHGYTDWGRGVHDLDL